ADALPPSAAEFAEWVSSRFGADASHSSVLDCGCGVHAFNIRACARLGFRRVEAIDVNPDVAVALRDQAERIGFTPGSVLDIPFGAGEFDLVICSGVAHHTPEPRRAFEEIARVLKPGGVAYISLYAFRGSAFHAFLRTIRALAHVIPYRVA